MSTHYIPLLTDATTHSCDPWGSYGLVHVLSDGSSDICYIFVNETKTWTDAQATCKARHGYLAEPKTSEQNSTISGRILPRYHPDTSVWLGATDMTSEGSWKWATSKTPVSDGLTNWNPGQPDDGGASHDEDCMVFDETTKHWDDIHCANNKRAFICQKPATVVVIG